MQFSNEFYAEANRLGNKLQREFKQRLGQYGLKRSALAASIKFKLVKSPSPKLKFTLNNYYKYVEQGRRPGKMPPTSAIKGWLEDKNINTGSKGLDSAAFAISKSIAQNGIEARPFVQPTLKNNQKLIQQRLGTQIEADLKAQFNQNLNFN